MIIRSWCAAVTNARPHEEGIESEVCRPSFMNILWMLTWIGAVTQAVSRWNILFSDDCANCYSACDRCSGHRRIPISHRSWNIIHHMWWLAQVWHQIVWLDLAFSMNSWTQHLIWQCWRRGSNFSSEIRVLWMTWLQHNGTHTHILLSMHSILNEWIFCKPLDWPWFSYISGTISMTTT